MVLEFAALVDPAGGTELLQANRPGLELLRLALLEAASPYADVLAAVCAHPAGCLAGRPRGGDADGGLGTAHASRSGSTRTTRGCYR